ncbi:MAG: hypothetical protein ACTHKB_00775 [Burkholderiaceae bacterium]
MKVGDFLYIRRPGEQRNRAIEVCRVTPRFAVTDFGDRYNIETGRQVHTQTIYASIATPEQVATEMTLRRVMDAQKRLANVRVTPDNLADTEHYLKEITK